MMLNDKVARPGQAPVLKVVKAPSGGSAPPVTPHHVDGESIFRDTRSGRDRREEGTPVDDPRRQNAERRRNKSPSAWWLERDYVESHHFMQKPVGARGLQDDDRTAARTT